MDPMFRDILSPHCPRQVKLGVPEDAIVQAWVGGQDSGTPPKPACHLQWYQLSQVLGDREELGGGLSGVTGQWELGGAGLWERLRQRPSCRGHRRMGH